MKDRGVKNSVGPTRVMCVGAPHQFHSLNENVHSYIAYKSLELHLAADGSIRAKTQTKYNIK